MQPQKQHDCSPFKTFDNSTNAGVKSGHCCSTVWRGKRRRSGGRRRRMGWAMPTGHWWDAFLNFYTYAFLFGSASDHQNRRTIGDDIDERHLQIYFVCAFCLSEIIAVSKTKDTPIWLQILLWGSVERVVWGLRWDKSRLIVVLWGLRWGLR